jgi:iodotyrosine deiodinase
MTTVHEGTNHFPEMQSLNYQRLPAEEQLRRAFSFLQTMNVRRTVRSLSPKPVPLKLVEIAIKTAVTAPYGANRPGDLSWSQIPR